MKATNPKTVVIIPAYNEEKAIGRVVQGIPHDWVHQVIVVDNGSSDSTAAVAERSGAKVVSEFRRGYGSACLSGISHLPGDTEVVVFMDGDYSDRPEEVKDLLSTLSNQNADMVIGSRVLGHHEKGSLTLAQQMGNWLSTWFIQWLYGFGYTDLGPFRAIRRDALERLKMQDRNYAWTVEMQVKALQQGLRVIEIPVSYRKRIGKSKVSGTISGTIKAGVKILWMIGKLAMQNDH
jgi:glycosyltransferase involved in cell wall biosynthesis